MFDNLEEETFLNELTKEEQALLLGKGTEIYIKSGSSLFLEGDPPTHIYLVRKGRIRLSKTNIEGKVLFFQLKQKDDFVGEFSLYNNLKATCNADVIKDAVLIRFERIVLEELCLENGSFALAFMKWFSKHHNILLSQFRDLIFCGKTGALYSILIRLSHAHGQIREDGVFINKKLTNQELANYIGATRESISRILKALINDGVISLQSKYITIHNLKFLQEQLRCEHCPYDECTI
ncbi:Crp/Fnr family transcriptional regulator [Anaerobacillus alkaliphilus]|uniref:Crp/Fnr family transcriptional regulator n=1 Tax=Anaerobacillus alkaliphilus TaxID=1548597 RepID=A0A4Q0VQZ8_9BACI|nr:Crp/Fnr family transcriptional regulator [Anaerobacillus alkaliphilus]RXI98357.1 Crp/Fnr family transcriptional regulator [Anaerobacillus alkaliphilus]